jgi:cytochrome c peroxidase
MHDGSVASLPDVIELYDRGGRSNLWLDAELRPLRLTELEKTQLVAFLQSLNGK